MTYKEKLESLKGKHVEYNLKSGRGAGGTGTIVEVSDEYIIFSICEQEAVIPIAALSKIVYSK